MEEIVVHAMEDLGNGRTWIWYADGPMIVVEARQDEAGRAQAVDDCLAWLRSQCQLALAA